MSQMKQKNNPRRDIKSSKPGAITGKEKSTPLTDQKQRQKQNNTRRRAKRKNQELTTLLILGAVVLVIVVAATVFFSSSQEGKDTVSSSNQALLVRADSPSRGPENAKVTLVEFVDPECESCRAAHPQIEELLKEYEGRMRFVVRYFTGHNNSALAVAATEAAGEQGKYWEMQSLLFANQLQWGEQRTPQTERFISYAQTLGLDIERFKASLQNPAYVAKANRDTQDARTLGVRGTPTFFVNGQMVFGMNKASLKALIDKGLRS